MNRMAQSKNMLSLKVTMTVMLMSAVMSMVAAILMWLRRLG